MKRMWRSVVYNFRQGGALQIFRKAVLRFRMWLWSETVWLVYSAALKQYRVEARLQLVQARMDCDGLIAHGYFKALAFPETIRARLNRGERCYGFFVDHELVNIAWTTRGALILEPGWSIDEAGSVGIYDCYTLPAHRGKGIYTDTLVRLLSGAQQEGARSAFIAVDPENRASIKGIERAGFTARYKLSRSRRFGKQWLRRSEVTAGRQTG